MNLPLPLRAVLVLFASAFLAHADALKVGVARERITPPMPFWLTGYASRTNPAATVNTELWTKAIAFEDSRGRRAVIVTTDLIGLPRVISDAVAEAARRQFHLARANLVLNSSHTHAGPVIWPNLRVMFDFDTNETARVQRYGQELTDSLIRVIGIALADLAPATVSVGQGTAGFAINRREPTANGVRIGVNKTGPVDHSVPILKVMGAGGQLKAVLFGYACHNTTLGGDFYQVDGDYAGAAQRNLEAAHPGTTALFLMLCGGDQNPNPRGTLAHVQEYGQSLARAVEQALEGPQVSLASPIRAAITTVDLQFAPHTRAVFEQESTNASVFRQRRAHLMLEAYDHRRPVRTLNYPIQALRFGDQFTLLALGGEVVVDYALRAKLEHPGVGLVVAGYCNDVACYIPSRRVLLEGGYEAVDSMIYYGQPGPFAPDVEDRVFTGVRRVLRKVGVK